MIKLVILLALLIVAFSVLPSLVERIVGRLVDWSNRARPPP